MKPSLGFSKDCSGSESKKGTEETSGHIAARRVLDGMLCGNLSFKSREMHCSASVDIDATMNLDYRALNDEPPCLILVVK